MVILDIFEILMDPSLGYYQENLIRFDRNDYFIKIKPDFYKTKYFDMDKIYSHGPVVSQPGRDSLIGQQNFLARGSPVSQPNRESPIGQQNFPAPIPNPSPPVSQQNFPAPIPNPSPPINIPPKSDKNGFQVVTDSNWSNIPEDKLCIICQDNPKTQACIPCGHKLFCKSCESNYQTLKVCSVCRAPIKQIIQIYD